MVQKDLNQDIFKRFQQYLIMLVKQYHPEMGKEQWLELIQQAQKQCLSAYFTLTSDFQTEVGVDVKEMQKGVKSLRLTLSEAGDLDELLFFNPPSYREVPLLVRLRNNLEDLEASIKWYNKSQQSKIVGRTPDRNRQIFIEKVMQAFEFITSNPPESNKREFNKLLRLSTFNPIYQEYDNKERENLIV